MNSLSLKHKAAAIIGVSLFFAALILVNAYFLADSPYRQTVTFLLISVWWIPYTYLLLGRTEPCCRKVQEDLSTQES